MARFAVQGTTVRHPMYSVRAVKEQARVVSIPAPVGGWDALSPLAQMPETNALALENMFPQPGYVEVRRGHALQNQLKVTAPVESLMAYHGVSTTTDAMFAAAGTEIYTVTVSVTTTNSAVAVSGLTNARFQHVQVATSGGTFLWICNGADAPRKFDGTTWTTASVSGITQATIVNCTVFKNRIWLVRNATLNAAYLNTDSVQGTATQFDLGGVFQEGGVLMSIGSWTVDAGDGPDDYIAFITDRGEVAVYTGTDPTTNFILKGVYSMGAPIGRRCLTKAGADLAIVCIDGVVPLSKALLTDRSATLNIAVTKNIQPVMNDAARNYADHFGWQLTSYAKGTRIVLNVPITENTEQQQYVMNTVTGGWCKFTGENANCWEIFRDRLYYGGNDGTVVEADCQGYDYDQDIEFNCEIAFNYCKAASRLKQFTMCRAMITTDNQVAPGLAVNVDFSRDATVDVITATIDQQALWDVALWDVGNWPVVNQIVTDWVSVAGLGYSASIRMNGSVTAQSDTDLSQPVTFQINGWNMMVQYGGYL